MPTELYPHQIKAVKELHHGSVLLGGVGTGKTRTSLAYFYTRVCGGQLRINGVGKDQPLKNPRDIYVITTARKRDEFDWQLEAASFRLTENRDESVSNVKMTVDSYNNIKRYSEVKNAFFIFDEQRLVGSGAWVKAFLKIAKENWWIMLSATPGDTWSDYMPLFIANGFYKNKTEFQREHVIFDRFAKYPKIQAYTNTGRLVKYRNDILVDMPMQRHTTRNLHYISVDYNKELYQKATKNRWDIFKEEPIQQAGQLCLIQRKIVNLDESRFVALRELISKKDRLIIFYSFDYELDILRKAAELEGRRCAEWNGHKHESVPITKQWVYLVQYMAGNEAWNCVKTDSMLFYSMQYSYRMFEQCQGRIDRLNTKFKDLHYYIFTSNSSIDRSLRDAINRKKDFNAREYEKSF